MSSMMDFPLELLTSELGDDGHWHARYPTARQTLCGRQPAAPRRGRKSAPTCGSCSKTARRFDRIDGSMPAMWKRAA